MLNAPEGVAIDDDGYMFIADTGNNRVRMVTPQGIIRTIAGMGTPGSTGNAAVATSAMLNKPCKVAVHPSDFSVYVSEFAGNCIRRIYAFYRPN